MRTSTSTNNSDEEFLYLIKTYIIGIEISELKLVLGTLKPWIIFNKNIKSNNVIETLIQCDKNIFPTVHKRLKVLPTLSYDYHNRWKNIYDFKVFKTYLRNTT